jgi:hypothetical protein
MIAPWAWIILETIGTAIVIMIVFLFGTVTRAVINKRWLIEVIRLLKIKDSSKYVTEHRTISVNKFEETNYDFKEKIKKVNKINYKIGTLKLFWNKSIYETVTLFSIKLYPSELYRDSRPKKWAIWYYFTNCRGKYLTVVNEKGEPFPYIASTIPGNIIFNARRSTVASEGLNSEYKENQGKMKSIIIILAMVMMILFALVILRYGGIKIG